MKQFDIIVECDKNNGIGKNNELPWNIKDEFAYFKSKTTYCELPTQKNIVIMGRKTFESINNILPNRINIVISSLNTEITENNSLLFCKSLHDALTICNNLNDTHQIHSIFVIGGGLLYNEAIHHPLLRYIYFSSINYSYNCDVYFPYFSDSLFTLKNNTILTSYDAKNNISVEITYKIYFNKFSGELQYINLLDSIYKGGELRNTRNSETYSGFGGQMIFNLQDGFPLLTTKKTFLRGIFEEAKHLMLLGNTDTKILSSNGIKIWEENTSSEFLKNNNLNYKEGIMGPMYGFQLRHFNGLYIESTESTESTENTKSTESTENTKSTENTEGIDQLQNCIDLMKKDPTSRRIIMTTYNPVQASKGVLYPCHGIVIQFYVKNLRFLSCHMYQRSVDLICGLPFNIASYALITHIIAQMLSIDVGELIISFGDVHVYNKEDHIEAVKTHTSRIPFKFPTLKIDCEINDISDINNIKFENIILSNYCYHPAIKVKMTA